ncbi:hypothetical protein SAMN02745746_01142 [Pseudogulbenkiania subflava DSM 22618]|uniref:Uncharacterized protein n=1 Tax=Pseudogulbenkiania subflava DSM 22618 TaxID=1123014 RepID=A0A1Y6BGB5_9NEIS|nr:hypothetical protein SAMN02745746_01142 [Pseudogulbenkiania subflava DSM 22618]
MRLPASAGTSSGGWKDYGWGFGPVPGMAVSAGASGGQTRLRFLQANEPGGGYRPTAALAAASAAVPARARRVVRSRLRSSRRKPPWRRGGPRSGSRHPRRVVGRHTPAHSSDKPAALQPGAAAKPIPPPPGRAGRRRQRPRATPGATRHHRVRPGYIPGRARGRVFRLARCPVRQGGSGKAWAAVPRCDIKYMNRY